MSDYFEGLKLAKKIGVPCTGCATSSIWCAVCAAKWRKACEDQKRADPKPPNVLVTGRGTQDPERATAVRAPVDL